MMLGEALLLTVLALAIVGALFLELFMDNRGLDRRWLRAAAAWIPIIATIVGWANYSSGADLLAAAGAGLLHAPILYAVARLAFWLRGWSLTAPIEKAEKERERLKYRVKDFGSQTGPAKVEGSRQGPASQTSPTDKPMDLLASSSVLARHTRARQGRWSGRFELVVVVLVCTLGVAGYVGLPLLDMYRSGSIDGRETLAATLDLNGFAAANITESATSEFCSWGEHAYQWGSLGAVGRACVDSRGGVKLWVDRKWAGRGGAGEPSPAADAQAAP